MPFFPDYVTSAQLKSALRITDTNDDAEIGFAISAASRAIDTHCNRQFGSVTSAVARYYTPTYQYSVFGRADYQMQTFSPYTWGSSTPVATSVVVIDDLMTTTNLVVKTDADGDGTFETTLTLDTDFRLFDWNAAADSRPWTMIVSRGSGPIAPGSLPMRDRAVEVTAQWGWTSVPAVVVQATLIQASRFFMRRLAPFGIAGSPDLGSELRLLSRLDPDVQLLLSGVRRYWAVV